MDTEQLHAAMPMAATMGLQCEHATTESVVLTLPWRADFCTSVGTLHGGALMALADSTGALLAFLNLPKDAATSTIESKTNLFRAVRQGDEVVAEASLLHSGRTTIVVETALRVGDRLVAKTTQTQAVLEARGS